MKTRRLIVLAAALPALAACGAGSWALYTWGEEYIEEGIPAEVFADGCAVRYSSFIVVVKDRALVDGDGVAVGEIAGAQAYDLTQPGPILMGSVDVDATHYDRFDVTIAPAATVTAGSATAAQAEAMQEDGASVRVAGTLTCGGVDKTFDWTFASSTVYHCEPEDLTVPKGGEDASELTIHGDHLFYDDLADADAEVRGTPVFDADANADGHIDQDELVGVRVADIGYGVGSYSDVTDLAAFIEHLTRTIGHVDGEGHCQVDF